MKLRHNKRMDNQRGKPVGIPRVSCTAYAEKLSASGLRSKAETLIQILRDNPYQTSPPYEKLVGDLAGAYSRRINIQHRIVYQILDDEKTVKIIRMWAHYE